MNIQRKRFEIQCMREHMSTETDLVNLVNKRQLQHFCHVVSQRPERLLRHVFEGSSTDKEAIVSPSLLHLPAAISIISRNQSTE